MTQASRSSPTNCSMHTPFNEIEARFYIALIEHALAVKNVPLRKGLAAGLQRDHAHRRGLARESVS